VKRSFWDRIALVVGTGGGVGLFGVMPGTLGSLVALPLVWWSLGWMVWARLALWTGVFLVGVWAARSVDRQRGSADNSAIVIDEIWGMGIATWLGGMHGDAVLAALIFFRAFDILKPPPIRQLDRWSKKKSSEGDFPFTALAKAYNCAVWSNDKELKELMEKSGFVTVFTTRDVIDMLEL